MQRKYGAVRAAKLIKPGACLRRQRGATLLEAVAYLGIAAIILIGAVALFSNAFQSARSNQLTEEVTAVENAVRNVYGRSSGGLAVNVSGGMAGLVAAKALPTTLTVDGQGNVTNDFGGTVTLALVGTNVAEVSFTQVPKAACMAALTAGGDWTGVGVSSAPTTAPPLTTSAAATACAGTTNTVYWDFTS